MSLKFRASTSVIALTRAQLSSLVTQNQIKKDSLYFISDESKVAIGVNVNKIAETSALLAPSNLLITSASAVSLVENTAFSFPLTATQTATWAIIGGTDAAQFTLSSNILSMTAKNFEYPRDSNSDNVYAVTIQATDINGNSTSQTLSVTVTNALESTLGPPTARYIVNSASGTVVAAVTGLDAGANETLTAITPNDGRFAIASGNRIVSGLSAITTGTVSLTATTSAGRTLSIVLSVIEATAAYQQMIKPPTDFGYTPPFYVYRRPGGSITHDFDIDAAKPTATNTVYVGSGGDNTKDGLSYVNRVRSLKQGIIRANALGGTVRLLADPALYRYSTVVSSIEDSFAANGITCNLIIESSQPGKKIISLQDVLLPAYVATTTDATVYVTTYTTQSVAQCVIDMAKLDVRSRPKALRRAFPAATDEATVVAAVNTKATLYGEGAFYLDTTNKKLYVKRIGSAAPDDQMVAIHATSANLNFAPATGTSRTLWTGPDVEVWGGNSTFRGTSNSTGNITVYANGTGASYSPTGHGFSFNGGPGLIYLVGCESNYHAQDGFNYNCLAGQPMIFHEMNCRSYVTGLSSETDGSNNGSTSHTDCLGVRVNCIYSANSNRTIHDIGNARTWNLGLDVRSPRYAGNNQTWDATYTSGYLTITNTSKIWLDSCISPTAASYDLEAYDGGQLFYANMDVTAYTNDVSGTNSAISAYTAENLALTISGAVILDPAQGKNFADNWNEIPDGGVAILAAGDHKQPAITRANTQGVTVYALPGAIVNKTKFDGAASKWTLKGIKFRGENPNSSGTGRIYQHPQGVSVGSPRKAIYENGWITEGQVIAAIDQVCLVRVTSTCSDIKFLACQFSAQDVDVSVWDYNQWMYVPYLNTLYLAGARSMAKNCRIGVFRNGISVGGDGSIIEDNHLVDGASDYVQFNANNLAFRRNSCTRARQVIEEFEALHGDFFQGYGADTQQTDGTYSTDYSNITIEYNYCEQGIYTQQHTQGISSFDGMWRNLVIRGNTVITGAQHGICFLGPDGIIIEGNTVQKQTGGTLTASTPWICVTVAKAWASWRVPKNVKIRNNFCDDIQAFAPGVGVYVKYNKNGSGYTRAGTTIAVSAPAGGGAAAATSIRNFTNTAAGQSTTGPGGINFVDVTDRAVDRYTVSDTITVSLTGDGTNGALAAVYCPTTTYEENGINQMFGNLKLDGTVRSVSYIDSSK